ncbi:MAG TPA: tetraacyldisaccharide 4'-kinase [Pirellulales bacterium]|nr:tetraacyldisaccharide 4'-kinase [Pirellulales bacterium]
MSQLAAHFREVVSGRRQGPIASCERALLGLAAIPYAAAIGLRNRYYDNPSHQHRVPATVISVGNLTLGGTGKTPFVAWLAGWLVERGLHVALVSRGYGARPGARNDEARELELALPKVPHVQNPDRVAAADLAIRSYGVNCIVMDDGFQHRRLARDLDVVLVDASDPLGLGHLFPRGTLREPLASLSRADVVVLSRADMVDADQRAAIRRQIESFAPRAVWVEAIHQPLGLFAWDRIAPGPESLAGQRVAAFCGIGNPAAFGETLKHLGCELVGLREFADHWAYSADDFIALAGWAAEEQAMLVCTMKDLVKIEPAWIQSRPVWALEIGLKITAGERQLLERLERLSPANE